MPVADPIAEVVVDDIAGKLVDEFSRHLLTGARRVLSDPENPLRLHMFASAIRELFGYTLHAMAPDAKVRECSWFKQDAGTPNLTRRQRVTYAIQGGLDSEYVIDTLTIDIEDMSEGVIETINTLHGLTHVRPDTLVTEPAAIAQHGDATLRALSQFLADIAHCRKAVADAVEEKVHDAVYDALSAETLPELDELSSHYSIEEHYVEKIEVTHIDSADIYYTVTATVSVGLQWGSNSDIRNDMGAVGEEDFPVNLKLKAPVDDPGAVESDDEGPVVVNTSSWWENYYDADDGIVRN